VNGQDKPAERSILAGKKMIRSFFLFPLVVLLLLTGCREATVAQQSTPDTLSFESPEALRAYFQWDEKQPPLISAHRGGPAPGFPENCVPTFERTLSFAPSILEMDVSMTADSVLILMHDNSLDRTTTGSGTVKNQAFPSLKDLRLVDNEGQATEFPIPTLEEVLEWGRGKAILSLDIKRGVPFERVIELIEKTNTQASVMIIVYSDGAARRIHELDPELLISCSIRNEEELDRMKNTGIPLENIVAFTGTSTKSPEFYQQLHALGISTILGTLGNLDKQAAARSDDRYLEWVELGADILATDRPEAVARILYPKK
jgi:glycerophosphoryl diester phosphodiesterase